MDSKLITFIGAPSSGKSTLAADVHTDLKKQHQNSILISEVATDFIAENGIPNTPLDQMVIFYQQLNKEKMFIGSKEYIICDSSGILNYFYFRTLFDDKLSKKEIAIINHLQKEILQTINQWDHIFYLPPMISNINDGVRYHNEDDIMRLDRWIKTYLEIENIPHHDMSLIPIDDRKKYILDILLNI